MGGIWDGGAGGEWRELDVQLGQVKASQEKNSDNSALVRIGRCSVELGARWFEEDGGAVGGGGGRLLT